MSRLDKILEKDDPCFDADKFKSTICKLRMVCSFCPMWTPETVREWLADLDE